MVKTKKILLIWITGFLLIQFSYPQEIKEEISFNNKWSFGIGGGWFGIPKEILDSLTYQCPSIEGATYGTRLEYEEGAGNVISTIFLLSLNYGEMDGSGIWQFEKKSKAIKGRINFTQYSITISTVFNFFDHSPINPYLGIGLGVGKLNIFVAGQLVQNIEVEEEDEVSLILPVLHIPLGLRFKIKDVLNIKIETGFQNGFYASGILSFYF
ncbi:MAG: hypothetical protein ACE5WD_01295 [Candidatus Aminicenantia bacterium]